MKYLEFIVLRPRLFAGLALLIALVVAALAYQQTGALALALVSGLGALGFAIVVRTSLLIRRMASDSEAVRRESAEVRHELEGARARFALLERRVAKLSVRLHWEEDPGDAGQR